ncbi:MAG TPA: DsbA family protein [Vicinamibacterales bacterium]|nr:DsbA family protein [Vicinamibacterales bacterium]
MIRILVAAMLAVVLGAPACAQSPAAGQSPPASDLEAIRKELRALAERQRALEEQLADLAAALGQPLPRSEVVLDLTGAPSRGRTDAPVTLVEFSDFQCPFCARHYRETMPLIERDYIRTGKVRYVFRDFPIESLHPQAPRAHEAAHCAGEQQQYWPMFDRLFGDPRRQSPADLLAHADALGLDRDRFRQCLESGRHRATVERGVAEAVQAGARGTPTIFLGRSGDGATLRATRVIRGAHPYARFREVIEDLLAR